MNLSPKPNFSLFNRFLNFFLNLRRENKVLILSSILLSIGYVLYILTSTKISFIEKLLSAICTVPIFTLIFIPLLWFLFNLGLFLWPANGLRLGVKISNIIFRDAEWIKKNFLLPNRKVAIKLDDSSPHTLIVGGTQTGKSGTMKTLLLEAIKKYPEHQTIIFDFHGEYFNFLKNNQIEAYKLEISKEEQKTEMVFNKKIIVVDFLNISNSEREENLANSLLKNIFEHSLKTKNKLNLFVDEAHKITVKRKNDFESILFNFSRESAKFGVNLFVASQNLTDFPKNFSANFGNIIIFRLPSPEDIQRLEEITGVKEGGLSAVINSLKKLECLLISSKKEYQIVKVNFPKGLIKK